MYKKILIIPYAIKGLAGFYFTLDFIEPKKITNGFFFYISNNFFSKILYKYK